LKICMACACVQMMGRRTENTRDAFGGMGALEQ
jgi:hypothetical protein